MEIRDTRNGDWHWVYNAVLADPHLFPNDKLVYSAISTFGGHQVIHPTIQQIVERCGVSERGVQLSLAKLEEVGYLSVEKSTGRGNANVYYLLKSPKGCNHCTLSKGCNEEQERVQPSAIKGAMAAPHIDIYKDKKDTTEATQSVGNEVGAFIKLFGGINPSYGELFKRKPQRAASERLLKLHPLSWWTEFMTAYVGVLEDRFCPKATTPAQMEDKFAAIMAYGRQRKAESVKTKQQIWV